jgi:hypothetical protein
VSRFQLARGVACMRVIYEMIGERRDIDLNISFSVHQACHTFWRLSDCVSRCFVRGNDVSFSQGHQESRGSVYVPMYPSRMDLIKSNFHQNLSYLHILEEDCPEDRFILSSRYLHSQQLPPSLFQSRSIMDAVVITS